MELRHTPPALAMIVFCMGCGNGGNTPDAGDASSDAPVEATTQDAGADVVVVDAESLTTFGTPITLSTPGNQAFVPSVATRDGEALVAWHEFADAGARILYTRVVAGVPQATQAVSDPFAPQLRPSVATTDAGYVIAYQANDGTKDVARAVELDATGAQIAGPDTMSGSGQTAAMVHAAANAGEEVFAWTDGTSHSYAMRGAIETVPATPVGTTLLSQGLLNFPRVAMDASGTVFLAYRDGGTDSTDWDVLLVTRAAHGTFGPPANVSLSPGFLSDDISLAIENDGTLDIAWVDQNPIDVNAFEVMYAMRKTQGTITLPQFYGQQQTMTWTPSVTRGAVAVWSTGGTGTGPLFIASPTQTTTPLLVPENGSMPSLAREPKGALDLAWVDDQTPHGIRFSRRP